MKRRRLALALASWLGAASIVASFVACATTDDAPAAIDETPDAQTIPMGDAATSDACVDGATCTAATDCTKVDFCATPFPVSRLVALNAIWGSGSSDLWAVGTRGTILHGDGTKFVPVSTGSIGSTDIYVAVWGTSSTDIWILGPEFPLHSSGFHDGSASIERRPGSSWNAASATTGRIWTGVAAGSKVWLAGEESARFGTPRSSFWSLGSDGDGGVAWTGAPACTTDQPCSPAIRGSWAADEASFWAVGRNGQAFTFEGATAGDPTPRWLGHNSNTRNDLEGVWGSGPDDVWAVGQHGTIRHTSKGSATWSVTPSPTTNDLHGVWGSGPKDVWAVGDAGTILHYDGQVWTLASLGLPNGDIPTNLLGVWGSGPDDVWIVGEGLLLRHTATSRRRP